MAVFAACSQQSEQEQFMCVAVVQSNSIERVNSRLKALCRARETL